MKKHSNQIPALVFFLTALLTLHSCITPKKGPQREYEYAAKNLPPFDAIIVPGIPFNNGNWDSVMKARLLWTMVLFRNGIAKNVIFSGGAVYSPYPESRIMGLYAQKLGIPEKNIFYETEARHSTENVYYSYLVAKQQGFKTLALATDPFQSSLLKRFTRKRFETPIYHIPFITDTIGAYNHLNPILNPADYERERKKNFVSITETEGFFKRLGGTIGWGIPWKKHKKGKLSPL